ncbi:helix-turn-helix domain-containing protein [Hamadaea sp. NPDC051192]|uniref:helix-turn-helix domain-containing protein n=1 Tax=Hamadaea sp. NPDC051192 TaxID=3154940 RepID=UPI003430D3F0
MQIRTTSAVECAYGDIDGDRGRALAVVMDRPIGERIRERRKVLGMSVRLAADRAGIHHSTWSRIETGQMGADNRYTLAAIATALRCSTSELTGGPVIPTDKATAQAQASVSSIRLALIETDLTEPPYTLPVPIEQLEREELLIRDLRARCDYVGAGRRAGEALRGLHAAAFGPDRETALRLLVQVCDTISFVLRHVGYPAETWLAAERAHQAAELLEDPVMLGLAAWTRANAATSCGSYQRTFTLASRGADDLSTTASAFGYIEVLGQLHLTCANALAGMGRVAEAADRLSAADGLAAQVGDTDTFGLMFGPANIGFWRVSMETDGGDPGRAVTLARAVNPQAVPSPSRQAAFYLDTARALARSESDKQALRMILAAERIAPQKVHSAPLVAELVRLLLHRAHTRAVDAELRGICERIGLIP